MAWVNGYANGGVGEGLEGYSWLNFNVQTKDIITHKVTDNCLIEDLSSVRRITWKVRNMHKANDFVLTPIVTDIGDPYITKYIYPIETEPLYVIL